MMLFVRTWLVCGFLFVVLLPAGGEAAPVSFVIHSRVPVSLEVKGYHGLIETILFHGSLRAGEQQKIDTSYQGLALLVFAGGQQYPLLTNETSCRVLISSPARPPSFAGCPENSALYRAISENIQVPEKYGTAKLMMTARHLLDSVTTVRTPADLRNKRQEFLDFVQDNYPQLQYSDMVRRLMARSFMMHEYVDYHVPGSPAAEIKKRFEQAVLGNVQAWLETLSPFLPGHEILNYCVSLYYNRSMVTMAGRIMDAFPDHAWCPGTEVAALPDMPPDLPILAPATNSTRKLADLSGQKTFALVSEKCPVSLAATVLKGRTMAKHTARDLLIILPLEPLSETILAMNRMIRNSTLLFVNNEQWRKDTLPRQVKLPCFVQPGQGMPSQ
jgi:hypothetical protein